MPLVTGDLYVNTGRLLKQHPLLPFPFVVLRLEPRALSKALSTTGRDIQPLSLILGPRNHDLVFLVSFFLLKIGPII